MVWRDAGEHDVCRCGGVLERRPVEVRLHDGETVLDRVRQASCAQCGARSYQGLQIAVLETVLKRRPPASPPDVW